MPAYERSPFPSGGGPHNGNLADFLWMLAFGAVSLLGLASLFTMLFASQPLFMMLIYVWSKRHPDEDTSFYMFRFKAVYMPWVMVGFSFIMGDDVVPSLLGISVGHLYYFLQEVLPVQETPMKGWHLMQTPAVLYKALGLPSTSAAAALVAMREGQRGGAPFR